MRGLKKKKEALPRGPSKDSQSLIWGGRVGRGHGSSNQKAQSILDIIHHYVEILDLYFGNVNALSLVNN